MLFFYQSKCQVSTDKIDSGLYELEERHIEKDQSREASSSEIPQHLILKLKSYIYTFGQRQKKLEFENDDYFDQKFNVKVNPSQLFQINTSVNIPDYGNFGCGICKWGMKI